MSHLVAKRGHQTVRLVIAIGNDNDAELFAGCRLSA
jgi:hypothetical protein